MVIYQDGKSVASVSNGAPAKCFRTGRQVEGMKSFVFSISQEGTNGRLFSGGVAVQDPEKSFKYHIVDTCAGGHLVNEKTMKDYATKKGLELIDNFAGNMVIIR